ncbi:MAG: hypothetical protein IT380_12070 [Myxococcales bacterium]|nr:hypothetical protein [Myxococcales bacterium]
MGFLGGVLKSVGNIIKPLAQTAIRAIAPAATGMLKGVVGDLFTAGKGALNSFMSALPLPSPLKNLAQKLLGKGLDALQGLAQGGIEKAIAALVNKLAPRTTADGVTVTTPPVTQPGRTDSIVRNNPSGGTSSSSGAASGGAGGASGSSSAAGSGAGAGWSGGPPDPSKYDMTSPEGANKFQADMFKYQQAMNNIATFWQTMSNAFKSQSDTQRAIAGNIR